MDRGKKKGEETKRGRELEKREIAARKGVWHERETVARSSPLSLSLSLAHLSLSLPSLSLFSHTHTHTHTHMLVFMVYGGLSIGVMVFILYKLYVLLPYTYPTPKLSPHRRRCISTFPPKKRTLYDL